MIDPGLVDSLSRQCRPLAGDIAMTTAQWQQSNDRPQRDDLLRLLRGLHTIKGGFAFFGFDAMRDLTHDLEEVLGEIRDHVLDLTPSLNEAIAAAARALDRCVDDPWQADIEQIPGLRQALMPWRDSEEVIAGAVANHWPLQPDPQAAAQTLRRGDHLLRVTINPRADVDQQMRTLLDLNDLIQMVGMPLAFASNLDGVSGLDDCIGGDIQMQTLISTTASSDEAAAILELADHQIEVVDCAALLPDHLSQTSNASHADVESADDELTGLLQGLGLLVSDLARRLDREAQAVISSTAASISDDLRTDLHTILSHLLRNAVDHGIEPPTHRAACGKPSAASVRISATINDDGHLVVEVGDDGQGIDTAAILKRAAQRGLISDPNAAFTTDAIYDLLFAPGFSTRDHVTTISGRGIGLDVVRDLIRQRDGHISVVSQPGLGTTFTVTLPLIDQAVPA